MIRVIHRADSVTASSAPPPPYLPRARALQRGSERHMRKPRGNAGPVFNFQPAPHANHECRLAGDQLFYGRRYGSGYENPKIGVWEGRRHLHKTEEELFISGENIRSLIIIQWHGKLLWLKYA